MGQTTDAASGCMKAKEKRRLRLFRDKPFETPDGPST